MTSYLPLALLLALAGCGAPFTMAPATAESDAGGDTASSEDAGADRVFADGGPSATADHFGGVHHDAEGLDAQGGTLEASTEEGGPTEAGGDACAVVHHDDGQGQSWADCSPLGTYTEAEALAACTAAYGASAFCSAPHICGTGTAGDPSFHAICGSVVCWAYDGPYVGMVTLPASGGCPRSGASMAAWR